jgi:hypothetical protein
VAGRLQSLAETELATLRTGLPAAAGARAGRALVRAAGRQRAWRAPVVGPPSAAAQAACGARLARSALAHRDLHACQHGLGVWQRARHPARAAVEPSKRVGKHPSPINNDTPLSRSRRPSACLDPPLGSHRRHSWNVGFRYPERRIFRKGACAGRNRRGEERAHLACLVHLGAHSSP